MPELIGRTLRASCEHFSGRDATRHVPDAIQKRDRGGMVLQKRRTPTIQVVMGQSLERDPHSRDGFQNG